jgi:S-adenosylmethionine:tRNA ribosyltransferase-isomerase
MELPLSQFDYVLPSELIAQAPCARRDQSRLLVLNRKRKVLEHKFFNQLLDHLYPGDVLVVNDTRVVPARLLGKKKTGGKVECLILHYPNQKTLNSYTSECLIKARRKIRPGERIFFSPDLEGEMLPPSGNGTALVRFSFSGAFDLILKQLGSVPLPPYIRRDGSEESSSENDETRYQTVYAENPGAVAAPTAGLHFTADLIEAIQKQGVAVVPLTLHVGYGTFAPVKTEHIHDHRMHSESFRITAEAAALIQEKKRAGGRVIAVGTTSVRALEYQALKYDALRAEEGECDLFITPGFHFKMVDGLITNFHLPRTTLLLLVSALAGREEILRAYREAIEHHYRFYSYGDAMLII